MNLKQLSSFSALELIGRALNKSILLILPFFLDDTNYAIVGLIYGWEMILPALSVFGFDRAILKLYQKQRKSITSFAINFSLFSNFLLLFITLLVNQIFSITEINNKTLTLLFLVNLSSNVILLHLNFLRAGEKFQHYNRIKLFNNFFKVILVVFFTTYLNNYQGYLFGVGLANITVILLFLLNYNLFKFEKKHLSSAWTNPIFVFSTPFVLHSIGLNLIAHFDRIIIGYYLDYEVLYQYTIAISVSSLLMFFFTGISSFVEPKYYNLTISKKPAFLKSITRLFIVVSLGGYLLLNLGNDFFLEKIYVRIDPETKVLVKNLSKSYLLLPFYLTSIYSVIDSKKTTIIPFCSLSSALLSILLNILFIQKAGVYGASLIFVFSYYFNAITISLFSIGYKFFLKKTILVYLAVVILINTLTHNLDLLLTSLAIIFFAYENKKQFKW